MSVMGGEVVKDLSGKNINEKIEIKKQYEKIKPGDYQIKGNKLIKY